MHSDARARAGEVDEHRDMPGAAGFSWNALLVGASALLGAATALAGDSYLPVSILFFWIAACAFYYLPAAEAWLQLLAASISYAAALYYLSGDGVLPGTEASVPALLLLSGALVGREGRERVERVHTTLAHAARVDPVTGLLNRRGFESDLWHELERAYRHGRAFAIVLLDVDALAQVNARLGHAAGDSAVMDIAAALERNKRDIDAGARLGGGEFALLLPETDERGGYSVAERMRMDIRERFVSSAVQVTVSCGIAVYPDNGRTPEELLTCAEQARALAKELGRDRCVIYNPRVATALSAAAARSEGEREHQLATIVALAEALDMRDAGTAAHSQAVARYASSIARELGLAPQVVERVRYAGLVHDVGKIAVPDAILRKPSALSDDEWVEMRKHPEIGAQLLDGADVKDIQTWVLAHHEREDGKGYPNRIPGHALPLEAKVLAVADAYEAMTADRSYRRGMRMEDACLQLVEGSGTQFDPRVVDAFIRLLVRSDPTVMSTVWERTNGAARIAAGQRRRACQPDEPLAQAGVAGATVSSTEPS
jgi:diguanylate cyclase (GGDEF)-like protein/putative nucleotidyltransferase with HDIG domain